MNYQDFLHTKIDIAPESGFDISDEEINPALKPHQRDAVRWAVKGGRRALFESFGLGKTAQQLEYCRIITEREGGQALIILPLGVKQEFQRDAARLLGMEEPPYVRTMEEVVRTIIPDAITDSTDSTTKNPDTQTKPCILLTNYERVRDGDIDPAYFTAVSLDEASVLRSFGSKTYQTFLSKLKGIPYKLVCTATPSPNRYKELIHYAGYLEIMDTGQALTRFFQRDSGKAGNLTLYPSREKEFWLWVSSWGYLVGAIGVLMGLLGWLRNTKGDTSALATWMGTVNAKLDHISNELSKLNDVRERVAMLERYVKTAYNRLDELRETIKGVR